MMYLYVYSLLTVDLKQSTANANTRSFIQGQFYFVFNESFSRFLLQITIKLKFTKPLIQNNLRQKVNKGTICKPTSRRNQRQASTRLLTRPFVTTGFKSG